jgi:hypothetical protein
VSRTALPNKRPHLVHKLVHAGTSYNVGFGFDEHGVVREAFADAKRTGTDVQALLHDACLLISVLAQNGMHFRDIAKMCGENVPEGQTEGQPSSIIGLIARIGAMESRA